MTWLASIAVNTRTSQATGRWREGDGVGSTKLAQCGGGEENGGHGAGTGQWKAWPGSGAPLPPGPWEGCEEPLCPSFILMLPQWGWEKVDWGCSLHRDPRD